MKNYLFIHRRLILSLITLFVVLVTQPSMAKVINLYEQPNVESKIAGTIDSSVGIITIFTPKNTGWIKVADPRNGNVGWIKSADIGNAGFSINLINTNNGGQGYQVTQYSGTEPHTPQQIQQTMKAIELRQQQLQKDMQKMIQEMFSNVYYPAPVIMPVVIVPTQSKTAKTPSTAPQAKPVTAPQQ